MAFYANHYDMFMQRAEMNRQKILEYTQKAHAARLAGDLTKAAEYDIKVVYWQSSLANNLEKAEENKGKEWPRKG